MFWICFFSCGQDEKLYFVSKDIPVVIILVNGIVSMKCTVFLILAASITVYMQCMPGDPQKVLVTSNDSRVRVYDNLDLVAKYKGTSHLAYLFTSQGFGICYLVQSPSSSRQLKFL